MSTNYKAREIQRRMRVMRSKRTFLTGTRELGYRDALADLDEVLDVLDEDVPEEVEEATGMKGYVAIRQNRDKLVTSFEYLDADQVNEFIEDIKQESIRWYGSRIEIDEEHDGDAVIYKVIEYKAFCLETISIIKQKKTDRSPANQSKKKDEYKESVAHVSQN